MSFLLLAALSLGAIDSVCGPSASTTLEGAPLTVPEARAIAVDAQSLYWPEQATGRFALLHADSTLSVAINQKAPRRALVSRFDALNAPAPTAVRWAGVRGAVLRAKQPLDRELLRGPLLLAALDDAGRIAALTRIQTGAWLDAAFPGAVNAELGALPQANGWRFALWAPTARAVTLCIDGRTPQPLRLDADSGVWSGAAANATGAHYRYAVDVYVPSVGWVRNRVTDPYSVSLTANGARSVALDLNDPALAPPGWANAARPAAAKRPTDSVLYELHVRDFSLSDSRVPDADRGKYLGFAHARSLGMQHLAALAKAGLTDVQLLPVYDFGSVPEVGCDPQATDPDRDCFNWGYDPMHFGAPEGSYASDPEDGALRVREFRQMVQSLHAVGLRVGMDVVYNHTFASGQDPRSVLDRIVPGYYHRLEPNGQVARSTCCENTATERVMMEKLMNETAVRWVRDYRIDSFRFDLMGHQPRPAMERLRDQVERAAGRSILLIGEGWNFGEVANNARFVQASQLELNGSRIATFSDRARDALRGGGCCDSGAALKQPGLLTGLAGSGDRDALDQAVALARTGLAGSVRSYPLLQADDSIIQLDQLRYGDQPAGYVSRPGEVVNYVENHDNPTLWDIGAFKLPADTSSAERARVQLLGAGFTLLSQGIPYVHAGFELLRSKSLDRNSYNSGDAFNRLDFSGASNHFGPNLPPEKDAATRALMAALLRNETLNASAADIRFMRDGFNSLLKVRASSALFRIDDSAQLAAQLIVLKPDPRGALFGGLLNGAGARIVYLLNVDTKPQSITIDATKKGRFVPHAALDPKIDPRWRDGHYDSTRGRFGIPPRTVFIWVEEPSR
jgi:pullulanase